MEDSTQFNIRISRALIDDMDFIARRLRISRAEWFKTRLAEMIQEEKQKALDQLSWAYITNQLSDSDYKDETGSFPTLGLRKLRASSKAAAARYLRHAAATTPAPPSSRMPLRRASKPSTTLTGTSLTSDASR